MTHRAIVVVALALVASGCSSGEDQPAPASLTSERPPAIEAPTLTDETPRDFEGLHNVVAYHPGFFSGSVPEGEAGFKTLAGMGVKTVISVDGAIPDVALAAKYGMTYIHLPIGYNGFDETRKLELSRATRDSINHGPVYMHCHHGKHRSAGAAGAVAVTLGWSSPDSMVERMKVSGTSPSYKGLYACTADAAPVSIGMLDDLPGDFPSVSPPQGLVKSMVEIDHITEHLKAIEKAGWTAPADHPDLVPVAEAGRMADLCRLLETDSRVMTKPADFMELLKLNGTQAQQLEDMLVAGTSTTAQLSEQFKLINASCKDCHVKFRD